VEEPSANFGGHMLAEWRIEPDYTAFALAGVIGKLTVFVVMHKNKYFNLKKKRERKEKDIPRSHDSFNIIYMI
jgi:hypothetical protein